MKTVLDTPVRTIMTTAFAAVTPHVSIDACMTLMTSRRTRHVLIMEGDDVRGIVRGEGLPTDRAIDLSNRIRQLQHQIDEILAEDFDSPRK